MKDEELYFSTGDAARELGVTQDRIVALCKADAIEAELTPGGHWRIREAVLNRLKERGLPPLARPLPGGDGPPYRRRRAGDDRDPHRLAGQAPTVVEAFSSVRRKEAELASRRLDLELLDAEEEIAQRRRRRDLSEREEEARSAARRRREEWIQSWLTRALEMVPEGAEPLKPDVYSEVQTRLETLRDAPDAIVEAAVGQVVERVLQPVMDGVKAVVSAMALLPDEMRAGPHERLGAAFGALYGGDGRCETQWETRAKNAAVMAVARVQTTANGQPVPFERLLVAAGAAVERVIADFKASKFKASKR
jgi:hypothetical protein